MSETQTLTSDQVGQLPTGVAEQAPISITAEAARKRAAAANFLPIVRGRLPLLFVHALRFDAVLNALSTKDAATKFGTSVGKVFDIRKGRNFAYITADFKPSAEDVAQAEAWIAQVGGANAKGLTANGDKNVMQATLDQYKAQGLASVEESAKFAAVRTSTRAKATVTAPASTGLVANTTVTPVQTEAVQNVVDAADDLLS